MIYIYFLSSPTLVWLWFVTTGLTIDICVKSFTEGENLFICMTKPFSFLLYNFLKFYHYHHALPPTLSCFVDLADLELLWLPEEVLSHHVMSRWSLLTGAQTCEGPMNASDPWKVGKGATDQCVQRPWGCWQPKGRDHLPLETSLWD